MNCSKPSTSGIKNKLKQKNTWIKPARASGNERSFLLFCHQFQDFYDDFLLKFCCTESVLSCYENIGGVVIWSLLLIIKPVDKNDLLRLVPEQLGRTYYCQSWGTELSPTLKQHFWAKTQISRQIMVCNVRLTF